MHQDWACFTSHRASAGKSGEFSLLSMVSVGALSSSEASVGFGLLGINVCVFVCDGTGEEPDLLETS